MGTSSPGRKVSLISHPQTVHNGLTPYILASWRRRGVQLTTLRHAAGISSTGNPALDERLPFDEPYEIPEGTAAQVNRAKAEGARVIAIGTTVIRALESAAQTVGRVQPGSGVARGRIGRHTLLRVADAILTGMHLPGDSHFELLQAFADESLLRQVRAGANDRGYRGHEFGDFMLVERLGPSTRPR